MAEDPIKAVLHYAQALKAPRIRESAARLAEQEYIEPRRTGRP